MLSLSVNELPFPSDQPQHISINRIELFVIPAIAIDNEGYRVCLRVSSNLGIGWSERFVQENEQKSSLDYWNTVLRTFIGRFPFSAITSYTSQLLDKDKLPVQMLASAVQQLRQQAIHSSANSAYTEEFVLRNRAIAYLSLDE